MAQLILGLDPGHDTVRQVRLRASLRRLEVEDFHEAPLPHDERPFRQRAAEALSQLPLPGAGDLAALALPGDEVSTRALGMPFADSRRIARTLPFELEGQLPFSLDQVVYDYRVTRRLPDGGVRLLAGLATHEVLRDWLQALSAVGIDPRLLGIDALSYTRLLDLLPRPSPDARVGLLDIGYRLSSLCVMGPEGVECVRTLSLGGRDLTLRLAEAFRVEPDEAESGKRRGAVVATRTGPELQGETARIAEALGKGLQQLVREVRQTLAAAPSVDRPLAQLWLCGGGARVRNLTTHLEEELGTPVRPLEAGHVDIPGRDRLGDTPGAPWAKALGLALHAHRGGRGDFLNLRRGAFAHKGDFEAVRGRLLQVAAGLLAVLLLWAGQAVTRSLSLSRTERELDNRVREITQAVLGKAYDNPEIAISVIKEKTSPGADPLPKFSALDALREIHERIPEDAQLRLKDLNLSPKKIRLEGFTDSFETVERIRAALQEVECFSEVQAGNMRSTKEQEVQFELTIVVGC
ncbi:MAG: pilus assembly protein PilM [Myxococcales bacterium]|nr:pilus assembly protein PilM [Myxococcales bacterium]